MSARVLTPAPPVPEPVRPAAIETVARSMVLVVDDEPAVRETTRRLLARMGLDVLVHGGLCDVRRALAQPGINDVGTGVAKRKRDPWEGFEKARRSLVE